MPQTIHALDGDGLECMLPLSVNFCPKKHVLIMEKVSTCFDLKRFSDTLPSLLRRFDALCRKSRGERVPRISRQSYGFQPPQCGQRNTGFAAQNSIGSIIPRSLRARRMIAASSLAE